MTRTVNVPACTSRATSRKARGRSMTADPTTRSGASADWSALAPITMTPGVSFAAWKRPSAAASALWWKTSTPVRMSASAASRPAAASSQLFR